MKKHTSVIGLRMLVAVRNTLYVRMTPTVMCHQENLVTDIGPAKEDTHDSKGVPPCWCSTKTGSVVSPHPQRTVTYQQLPHQPRKRTREIITSLVKGVVKDAHNPGTPFPKTEDAFKLQRMDQDHSLKPKDCHLTSLAVPRFCNVLLNRNVNIFVPKLNEIPHEEK